MRKFLLSIAALGGIAAGGGVASAAPAALPGPTLGNQANVETVQYYPYAPDWRARHEWREHRMWEWRRREALRHEYWRARHLRPYGYYRY